jgi:methylglutaconyl-CoA hydratase
LRVGLVHVVTERLDEEVDRLVGEILRSGPEATRAAKRLAREQPAEVDELARIAAGLRTGEEGQEGLRAFLERRAPRWAG